jgi:hypothetical protein
MSYSLKYVIFVHIWIHTIYMGSKLSYLFIILLLNTTVLRCFNFTTIVKRVERMTSGPHESVLSTNCNSFTAGILWFYLCKYPYQLFYLQLTVRIISNSRPLISVKSTSSCPEIRDQVHTLNFLSRWQAGPANFLKPEYCGILSIWTNGDLSSLTDFKKWRLLFLTDIIFPNLTFTYTQ